MSTQRLSILFLIAFLLPLSSTAQSWRKNVKEAEELFGKGIYLQAADLFQAASERKPKKTELANKAGDAYMFAKEYAKAAEAYAKTLGKSKQFPKAGLKYALALKQAGQYEEASRALSSFIGIYNGEDVEQMALLVENEIRGCELGQQIMDAPAPTGTQVLYLGAGINSNATEFAPIPYNEDILYFSSIRSGRAQIYRTQQNEGQWEPPSLANNFPKIKNDHFCNGTFTPDNMRFYFTICRPEVKKNQNSLRCEIYVTKRQGNAWSLPERLRDYINLKEASTADPFVIFNGTTEILYFSSNRPGGYGGMDLWYITRDIDSKDFDFTYPINCGATINTASDERSPYYDLEEATLYFSSNGHISIGGFDIQKASGSRSQWKGVENIGAPFNSRANDYYFVRSPSKRMGFFVSNRSFEPEKTHTRDEDIFQFFYALGELSEDYPMASGYVYDKLSGEVLTYVDVEVFEITETGEKFLVGKDRFTDGNYTFSLLNDRQYEITARKKGFEPGTIRLRTEGPRPSEKGYSTPIFLDNLSRQAPPPPPKEPIKAEAPPQITTNPDPAPATLMGGTSYRIQVSAVKTYRANRFASLKDIGILQTEKIPDRGLTRVMVGNFPNMEKAEEAKRQAVKKGFKGAIVVLYEDGKRIQVFD